MASHSWRAANAPANASRTVMLRSRNRMAARCGAVRYSTWVVQKKPRMPDLNQHAARSPKAIKPMRSASPNFCHPGVFAAPKHIEGGNGPLHEAGARLDGDLRGGLWSPKKAMVRRRPQGGRTGDGRRSLPRRPTQPRGLSGRARNDDEGPDFAFAAPPRAPGFSARYPLERYASSCCRRMDRTFRENPVFDMKGRRMTRRLVFPRTRGASRSFIAIRRYRGRQWPGTSNRGGRLRTGIVGHLGTW